MITKSSMVPGVRTGAPALPQRKVMSSTLAIATALWFGAASALVSFAIDRSLFGDGAQKPIGGDWRLRGALAPADELSVGPAARHVAPPHDGQA